MWKKYISVVAVFLAVAGVVSYILVSNQPKANDSNVLSADIGTAIPTPETRRFTMDEISKHSSENDCYIIIENKVYDATTFISSHPGGKAILMGCGTDATVLFNNRPNNKGAHSENARTLLEKLYIGDIR